MKASAASSTSTEKRGGKAFGWRQNPSTVRSIPTLHALWPEAKFVHLIPRRPGRVPFHHYLSWSLQDAPALQPEAKITVGTTAFWWEWKRGPGPRGHWAAGTRSLLRLRYDEALIANTPEENALKLSKFLDVMPYEDAHAQPPPQGPGADGARGSMQREGDIRSPQVLGTGGHRCLPEMWTYWSSGR